MDFFHIFFFAVSVVLSAILILNEIIFRGDYLKFALTPIDVAFLVVFFVGLVVVFRRRWTAKRGRTLHYLLLWIGLSFAIFSLIIDLSVKGMFISWIPIVFFGFFAWQYLRQKARLINGLWLNLFVGSLLLSSIFLVFKTGNLILMVLLIVLAIIMILVLAFGGYALLAFLYWNSYQIFKRERRSLANGLTLILAVFLTVYVLFMIFGVAHLPEWAKLFMLIPGWLIFYFFIVFWNFLTISILYQFNHPKYNQDFIIVLGAGLMNGGTTVTPLLAKRIDRAIQFQMIQHFITGKAPKLLMSGGQGPDEAVPESVAMKEYALAQGIPESDILTEEQSTTTLENMRYSLAMMQKIKPDYKAIFSSNNYHIFRAGIFAAMVGLKADGIGSKTAFYYLPNAFLREFAAIVMMHKKFHLVMAGGLTAFLALLGVVSLFIT
jgi:uncharacterized SAM-binding protein YcdF (DUF218 family)